MSDYSSEGFVWGPVTVLTDVDPWTYDLGVSQGRIQPANWTVPDGAYVFCAGSDLVPGPRFRLEPGDQITLEQSIDLTGIDLIGSRLHIRQPSTLPSRRDLQGSPEDVQLYGMGSALLSSYQAVSGTVGGLILAPSATFTAADLGQTIEITSSVQPPNDGRANILGIVPPAIAGQPATLVLVDKILVDEGPTFGMSVALLGARYRAAIYVDGALRLETIETLGRERDRIDFKLHVSKLAGPHVIRFALELVEEPQA